MELRHIRLSDNKLLVQHNNLVEARYFSSLNEQRIMLWLIAEIKPEDRDFQAYRISIKELAAFLDISNKNFYKDISEITKGMIGRVVTIGSLEDGELVQAALISSAVYKPGEGYVDIEISSTLRPYLLDVKKNFTKSDLKTILYLKSGYAIRIYNLLNQYRKIKSRTMSVDELKEILGITDQYAQYKNFKSRVVAPSIEEINDKTDLEVTLVEIKKGRSVVNLKFDINVKNNAVARLVNQDDFPTNSELFQRLVIFGMKQEDAHEVIDLYGETDPDRITVHLEQAEAKVKKGKIQNPIGWLRTAIREDYREQGQLFPRSEDDAKKDAEARRERQSVKEKKIRAIERRIDEQKAMYAKYRTDFVMSIIKELSPSDEREWKIEFEDELGDDVFASYWKQGDRQWDARGIITRLENFIYKKTGKRCDTEDHFFLQQNKPTTRELEAERLRAM